MASSSAAERSATTPELRHLRGQQVILVFSNQGMGNWTNAIVILISMGIFGVTGTQAQMNANPQSSKNVLCLTYGYGAVACVVMVLYRFIFLKESQVRAAELLRLCMAQKSERLWEYSDTLSYPTVLRVLL